MFDHDLVQPEPNVRSLVLDNNKLNLKREDPFGFIYISFERGQTPDRLKGAYTSFEEAAKQAKLYLQEKNRKIKEET